MGLAALNRVPAVVVATAVAAVPVLAGVPLPAAATPQAVAAAAKPASTAVRTAAASVRAVGAVRSVPVVRAGGTVRAVRRTPDEVWDRIAECESDGDWQADTGNGYYGGLQIWPPTWREADGLRFAARPDLATRREQITVGEEILRQQGWEAWPGCAADLGLLPD
ncbi:transglycosylase family protein [Kitasatospora sp. NPDC048540]|uniref:transglycosylase family protein n=1 Tax=unclassified Kitasatospora TaxID=2633591 RepID=UPI0018F52362|nr:transglycosylase family protein [Kitasatospora sp. MBT63]